MTQPHRTWTVLPHGKLTEVDEGLLTVVGTIHMPIGDFPRRMTTLYGIPNCDTVKKARAWLAQHGIAHEFHDFKKLGVPPERLRAWVDAAGWERLLNRQEDADIARRRVQRADEGDDQQGPERREGGEADTGQRHQQRGAEQQPVRAEAMAPGADGDGRERRAEHRRGRDHADF